MSGEREKAWEEGLAIVAEQFSPEMAERLRTYTASQPFGAEIGELALRNAYLALWLRDGLSRRDRSLVTVAMLVALGSEHELHHHAQIAIQNGVTVEEMEELVYHATAYAGFPAASSGRSAIQQSLLDMGVIDQSRAGRDKSDR
jgi:4-carboxymuconolactone decarboxylase